MSARPRRVHAVWLRPEAGDFIRLGGEQFTVHVASDNIPYVVRNGVEYQLRLGDKSWIYDKNRMDWQARANRREARRLVAKLKWLGRRDRERKNVTDKIKSGPMP